jgi:hypothetical protein
MNEASYLVNIRRYGTRLGAGFLLTGCYVLTAHHCLGDAPGEGSEVEIEFEDGEVLAGRVHRRSPMADLALIDIPESGIGPVIPRADRARVGEAWRSPYRPSLRHAVLSGTIEAVPIAYECDGGDPVEAMQLVCAEDLKDYAGYSGSPVESGGPDGESKLFGVLIEQYPEQNPDATEPWPASKVLFATTISEVFRRFDCFDVGHLINLLPSSSGDDAAESPESNGKSPACGPESSYVQSRIAIADKLIEALDGLLKRGLLDEQHVTALKLRVIEEHLFGNIPGARP